MQTKPRRTKSTAPTSPLVAAQAAVLTQFKKQIVDSLGRVLGREGLARVQRDVAVVSNLGDQVAVHAPLKPKGTLTYEGIAKTSPIVGVIATTATLRDPVTGKDLKPGAYAVRLRAIGRGEVAFDYMTGDSVVAFSTRAVPTKPGHVDPRTPLPVAADVLIILPSGKGDDPLWPPGDGGDAMGAFCISFMEWTHCWQWAWPVFWSH